MSAYACVKRLIFSLYINVKKNMRGFTYPKKFISTSIGDKSNFRYFLIDFSKINDGVLHIHLARPRSDTNRYIRSQCIPLNITFRLFGTRHTKKRNYITNFDRAKCTLVIYCCVAKFHVR